MCSAHHANKNQKKNHAEIFNVVFEKLRQILIIHHKSPLNLYSSSTWNEVGITISKIVDIIFLIFDVIKFLPHHNELIRLFFPIVIMGDKRSPLVLIIKTFKNLTQVVIVLAQHGESNLATITVTPKANKANLVKFEDYL